MEEKGCYSYPVWETRTPVQWQKCPICNGSGVSHVVMTAPESSVDIPQLARVPCNTCRGYGIINLNTGLPPTTEVSQ